MVTHESMMEIQIKIINRLIGFYKPLMITQHSYPVTDFINVTIMEIDGTDDDSKCDLWNNKRITKIFDWIVESQNPLNRDKSDYITNYR